MQTICDLVKGRRIKMIFIIRTNKSDGWERDFKDWYEITSATPSLPHCAFYANDFHAWFLKWVFKRGN